MRVPLLLLSVLLFGGDDFADGVRAYEAGRYQDALDAFAAAEAAAGDAAPPALLFDRALAALRVGRVREAEYTAEKLVVRGGPEFEGFREFVFGNAAWQRMERAKAEAGLTDPDPTALARAIRHAQSARDAWVRVVRGAADWPRARRNVERAQRALDELARMKEEADANRRSKRAGGAEAGPEPGDDDRSEEVEQVPVAQQDDGALTAEQLEGLLDRLAQKEREKRALRLKQREARTAGVERDW